PHPFMPNPLRSPIASSFTAVGFALLLGCGSSGDGGAPNTNDGGGVDSTSSNDVGATTDSSSSKDTAPYDAGPPVQACVDVPSGEWQDITPAALHREWWCTPDFNPAGCGSPGDSSPGKIATYGAHYVASAPSAPGTVYLGTSSLGL